LKTLILKGKKSKIENVITEGDKKAVLFHPYPLRDSALFQGAICEIGFSEVIDRQLI